MADSMEMQDVAIVELQDFINYVRHAAHVLLPEDGGHSESQALSAALEDRNNLECLAKFIGESQVSTLFIQRNSSKDDDGQTEGEEEREPITDYISNEVHYTNAKMSSLVVNKRAFGVIKAAKSIGSQVLVMTFSEGSPYEDLHTYISKTVAPFFKSYVKKSDRADRDGDKMASNVEKSIAEVEMGLLDLQQYIDIPEVTLPAHPLVASMVKQCADKGRKPKIADFGDRLEDPNFLNALHNGVKRWIKDIQKVSQLDRDSSSGTALQEIAFWLNLERALHRIQEKRKSLEVALTLQILKHGKRFHANFDTDTGLKQALATVNDYNRLMKDFPIHDLLNATELERISASVQLIFAHLRKVKATQYPIQRCLRLVEALSRDLASQLHKVLGTRGLFHILFDEFEQVMTQCFEVFSTWEDEYEHLVDFLRKKRNKQPKIEWHLFAQHKELQTRMEQIHKIRHQHDQLCTLFVRVLRRAIRDEEDMVDLEAPKQDTLTVDAADTNAIEEVCLAHENVQEIDCLDISYDGQGAWDAAVQRYEKCIDRVEARITVHLRDQLGTAKNANEMFRVFSRFNGLLKRPHISAVIGAHQAHLMQRVKDDVEALHEKFQAQYSASNCARLSKVRDIPPVAGSIIWMKQIDHQLSTYLRRVENVLGEGWKTHIESQKLKADADSFRAKLDTEVLFEGWLKDAQALHLDYLAESILSFKAERSNGGEFELKVKVNFKPEIITLSKEVRHMKVFGFRVPLAIVDKAHTANLLYPFAISLIASMRAYEMTLKKMEDPASIIHFDAGLPDEAEHLIADGRQIVWESYKLEAYSQRLSDTIVNFQERIEELVVIGEWLDVDVRLLGTCPYSAQTFYEEDTLELTPNKDEKSHQRMSLNRCFFDEKWSKHRAVTALDWSAQHPELLLAAYNDNEVSPNEPDGVCLVWNTECKNATPEYRFYSQSPVLTAKFVQSDPNLVLGGTYSGQIVLWDKRVRNRTSVQRTLISAGCHTQPVYCMHVVGSQNAHNLITISNDGKLCSWSLDMLSQPQEVITLVRSQSRPVAVTCLDFPHADVNNFVVGGEEGAAFAACWRGATVGVVDTYNCHTGPITGISVNGVQGGIDFSHMFLTASMDWTMKLWSLKDQKPIYSFEDNGDCVMDVAWSPIHLALFASVDCGGKLDLWHLNQNTEVPAATALVDGGAGLNKVAWTPSGLHVTVGDEHGRISVYDVAESFAQPRNDDWNQFLYTTQELRNNQVDEELEKLNLGISNTPLFNMTSMSSLEPSKLI